MWSIAPFRILTELLKRIGPGAREGNSVLRRAQAGARTMLVLLACIFSASGCGRNSAPVSSNYQEKSREPVPQSTAVAPRYDLAHDEERGGHTLRKHVAQTDEQLAARLRHERNISAASTWTNVETAEETVAGALASNRERIDSWIRRGYPRPNLALHDDAGRIIGRSLGRGAERPVECTSAVVVLRADGPDTFYVLTTYPEARE